MFTQGGLSGRSDLKNRRGSSGTILFLGQSADYTDVLIVKIHQAVCILKVHAILYVYKRLNNTTTKAVWMVTLFLLTQYYSSVPSYLNNIFFCCGLGYPPAAVN